MITNKEVIVEMRDILSKDETLRTYSAKHFQKEPMILIGVDINQPPDIGDYPVIVIQPSVQKIGNSEVDFTYNYVIQVYVKGDEEPEKINNTVTYTGLFKAEELSLLVRDAIDTMFDTTNVGRYSVDFYQNEIEAFPVYTSLIVIGFSMPNVICDEQISFK